MNTISLIFPHQLFEQNPCVEKDRKIVLVEEFLFFRQFQFHKKKLMLHRASMKHYESLLTSKGFSVEYIEATESYCDVRKLLLELAKAGVEKIVYCDTADNWLEKRLREASAKCGIKLLQLESPNFICSKDYLQRYFNGKRKYFLTSFYTEQRLRFNILVDKKKPLGGKWTFDTENRKKIPANIFVPPLPNTACNRFIEEAAQYVEKNFKNNYGTTQNFIYPITFDESQKWLQHFFEQRFTHYGTYQDAIVKCENFLFHSVISPMLNIGLLTPEKVITSAVETGLNHPIGINSIEGFVRQVLGWREYIRAVYEREGSRQRTANYWNHQRTIPHSFYCGNTGILPIDETIKKLNRHAYNHHIERLMILGNFMCLCEFNPDEVYRWFMEMYIDAYDWVMVPNVYGMSQFADGGVMSTKPYISSSNYVLKMSDYPKGDWCEIWDSLYWRFIYLHRDFFEQNPRMSVMTKQLDKKGSKLHKHLTTAENFLSNLH